MAFLQRVLSGLLSLGPCGDCSPDEGKDVKERSPLLNGNGQAAAQNLQLPDQTGHTPPPVSTAFDGKPLSLESEASSTGKHLEQALASAINTGIAEGQQEITALGSGSPLTTARSAVPATPPLTRDLLAGGSSTASPDPVSSGGAVKALEGAFQSAAEKGAELKDSAVEYTNGVVKKIESAVQAAEDVLNKTEESAIATKEAAVEQGNGVVKKVELAVKGAEEQLDAPKLTREVKEALLASEPVWTATPPAEAAGAEVAEQASETPVPQPATLGNTAFWMSAPAYHVPELVAGAEPPLENAPAPTIVANKALWADPAYHKPELVAGASSPLENAPAVAVVANKALWADPAYHKPELVAGATSPLENAPEVSVTANKALWMDPAYHKPELVAGAPVPLENAPAASVKGNAALWADPAYHKPELVEGAEPPIEAAPKAVTVGNDAFYASASYDKPELVDADTKAKKVLAASEPVWTATVPEGGAALPRADDAVKLPAADEVAAKTGSEVSEAVAEVSGAAGEVSGVVADEEEAPGGGLEAEAAQRSEEANGVAAAEQAAAPEAAARTGSGGGKKKGGGKGKGRKKR